jgi:hypothetical protein
LPWTATQCERLPHPDPYTTATDVHTHRKESRKPSLSSGNRCRTVHSCNDVLTHEHCGGAATMLKSIDTKQLSRASRAVTPEGCSGVEASHHRPARAHGSSAGRKAHFWRRGRAAGAERSWKAAPHGEGDMPYYFFAQCTTRAIAALSLSLMFRSDYRPTYYQTSSRTGMCRQGLMPPR